MWDCSILLMNCSDVEMEWLPWKIAKPFTKLFDFPDLKFRFLNKKRMSQPSVHQYHHDYGSSEVRTREFVRQHPSTLICWAQATSKPSLVRCLQKKTCHYLHWSHLFWPSIKMNCYAILWDFDTFLLPNLLQKNMPRIFQKWPDFSKFILNFQTVPKFPNYPENYPQNLAITKIQSKGRNKRKSIEICKEIYKLKWPIVIWKELIEFKKSL